MRSRDGSYNFSLSICSVVLFLFSSTLLNASDYLVSYRYVVKDAILYNETLDISKSMKKCIGEPTKSLILDSSENDDLEDIILKNSTEFIDFIHTLGLQVEHKESTTNAINKSTTILTLKTTCFEVDFNDNFARISPLK
jgi:hypothetical protein